MIISPRYAIELSIGICTTCRGNKTEVDGFGPCLRCGGDGQLWTTLNRYHGRPMLFTSWESARETARERPGRSVPWRVQLVPPRHSCFAAGCVVRWRRVSALRRLVFPTMRIPGRFLGQAKAMGRTHHQKRPAGRGVTEQQFFLTQEKLCGGYLLELDSLSLGDEDPVPAYLESLAPGSRPAQWLAVKRIVGISSRGDVEVKNFEWAALNSREVVRLRRYLVEHLAPATGRRYLSALRGVIEMAWQLKLIDGEKLARLTHKRILKPIRGESSPPGRALDRREVIRLFNHCAADVTLASPRDAAILALLYGGGLRRLEVINLDVEDIDLEAGEILVSGKGRRERRVPLPDGAIVAIRGWLRVRRGTTGPLMLRLGPEGG